MRMRVLLWFPGCCALLLMLGLLAQALLSPQELTLQVTREAKVEPERLMAFAADMAHFSLWSPWEERATGHDTPLREPVGQHVWQRGHGIERGRVEHFEQDLPLRLRLIAERPQLGQGELQVDHAPAGPPNMTRITLTLRLKLSPLYHLLSPILRPEPRLRRDLDRAVDLLLERMLDLELAELNARMDTLLLGHWRPLVPPQTFEESRRAVEEAFRAMSLKVNQNARPFAAPSRGPRRERQPQSTSQKEELRLHDHSCKHNSQECADYRIGFPGYGRQWLNRLTPSTP